MVAAPETSILRSTISKNQISIILFSHRASVWICANLWLINREIYWHMSTSVLLTSAPEDSEEIIDWMMDHDVELRHLPLERYVEVEQEDVFEHIEEFETIIYGNKRNAIFFLRQAMRHNALPLVRERVNLTLHR